MRGFLLVKYDIIKLVKVIIYMKKFLIISIISIVSFSAVALQADAALLSDFFRNVTNKLNFFDSKTADAQDGVGTIRFKAEFSVADPTKPTCESCRTIITPTPAEFAALRMTLTRTQPDSLTIFTNNPLGTYTLDPADEYRAVIRSDSIPDSLWQGISKYKPNPWGAPFSVSSGDNKTITLMMYATGIFEGPTDVIPAPNDTVVQESSNAGSIGSGNIFYDKRSAGMEEPGYGQYLMAQTKVVRLGMKDYLFQGYSGPTGKSYLAVFDLADPLNPSLVTEMDVRAEFDTRVFVGGVPTPSNWNLIKLDAVENDGKIVGFLRYNKISQNAMVAQAFFSFDGSTLSMPLINEDHGRFGRGEHSNIFPMFDVLFKGVDGDVYGFGKSSGSRVSNVVLQVHRLSLPGDHVKVYEGDDIYELIGMAIDRHINILPVAGGVGVLYIDNKPYIVMADIDYPDYWNDYLTTIIDVSDPTNMTLATQQWDELLFTPGSRAEGDDRTAPERLETEFLIPQGRQHVGIPPLIVDDSDNYIYQPYWFENICRNHNFECFGRAHTPGEIRYRNVIGVADFSNLSNPAEVAQPILGSYNNTTGFAEGTFTNIIGPIVAGQKIIIYDTSRSYDIGCVSEKSISLAAQPISCALGGGSDGLYVGIIDDDDTMYWIPDASQAFAGPDGTLLSGDILSIGGDSYAAYISRGGVTEVVQITKGDGGIVTPPEGDGGGGGPPASKPAPSIFSPNNLLRFFRSLLGL